MYTHTDTHTAVTRRSAVFCICVLWETPQFCADKEDFHSLHTSHEPANCPPLPSTVRQLDWQLANVWASRHVRGRNLSDKQLSEAHSNWLVRPEGGRRQIGETESNRQVAGVISFSMPCSLIRLLVKQITGSFSLGFWVFSPFHLHGKIQHILFFWSL